MNKDTKTLPADEGRRLSEGLGGQQPARASAGIGLIHISWAGPERWLTAGGKQWVFEDHRYFGPIVLCNKTREPAKNEPPEGHAFWHHVNAWYQQGKQTNEVGGKVWCVYETQMQTARKRGRAEAA